MRLCTFPTAARAHRPAAGSARSSRLRISPTSLVRYPRRDIPSSAVKDELGPPPLLRRRAHRRWATFRSRSIEAVVEVLRQQSRRYGSTDFIFLDIKLNSNLDMGRAHRALRGARAGSALDRVVHVQARRERTRPAAAPGCGRGRPHAHTFGFESGSQRPNDAMAKAT